MAKQSAKHRSLKDKDVQQQQQLQQQGEDAIDREKAARVQKLVLQTSLVVAASMVAAYYGVISDKMALAIMAGMCLCLRFFAM